MSEEESFAEYLKKKYAVGNIEAVMNSDKIFFNEGVDACIEAAKKEFDYWDTEGGTVTMGDLRFNLNLLFEQLKKPLQ